MWRLADVGGAQAWSKLVRLGAGPAPEVLAWPTIYIP
jgi:hypothetical protein